MLKAPSGVVISLDKAFVLKQGLFNNQGSDFRCLDTHFFV